MSVSTDCVVKTWTGLHSNPLLTLWSFSLLVQHVFIEHVL
jgi:hypothetical protein